MSKIEWMEMFGDNLKSLLDEKKISQQGFAQELGISESTVSNYILGKRMPDVRMILKISYILDCDLYDLIDFGEMID